MRSTHADKFNHDADADGYDLDVRDEAHPIRAGYDAVLSWVASQVPAGSRVVDLGSGTGNLAARIEDPARLICVDISEQMSLIAKEKLRDVETEFLRADLLECFETLSAQDAFVSTYAVHHLTAAEKLELFRCIAARLQPGGLAVFGDLMFESNASKVSICEALEKSGPRGLVDEINDEFFWTLDRAIAELVALGFEVTSKRFSLLSFGICAVKQ